MIPEAPSPFSPGQLGPLRLRNRVIRTAAFEGMTPEGEVSEQLIEHHRRLAAGGVGMTTVAYCAVARDGLTFEHQLHMRPAILPDLRRLTDAVHEQGAAAMLQIGHAGYFANPQATGTRPLGASDQICLFTLSRARRASRADLVRLTEDFVRAAERAVFEAGFDAVELHMGHGYLLSQFLSPATNRRRDEYGGALIDRMRFPLQVVRRVRRAIGPKATLVAKLNLSDGFRGGLAPHHAAVVARALEAEGLDGLVLSGGFVSRTPFYMLRGEVPVAQMIENEKTLVRRLGLKLFGRLVVKTYAFEPMFFFEQAKKVRRGTGLPLVLLGGIRSLAHMQTAMDAGFEFVSMGRPLIQDPDLIKRMIAGELDTSPCEPCNLCVAEMEAGGIRCSHPGLSK